MIYFELTLVVVVFTIVVIFANDIGAFMKMMWAKPFIKNMTAQLLICTTIVFASGLIDDLLPVVYRAYNAFLLFILSGIGASNIHFYLAKILVLLLIPLGISLVPANIYWFAKSKAMPFFYPLWWGLFLVYSTLIMLYT